MNELSAGDQSLLHGHLAPGAEAVGEFGGGRFGAGGHGRAFSMRAKKLVNRPLPSASLKKNSPTVMQMKEIMV
jgi:hypothetical protein